MALTDNNSMSDNPGNENVKRHTDKIALLFTDMKGSTDYYKKHGDLAGRIAVEKIHKNLVSVVTQYRGVLVKTIGDSIMTYFYSASDALWAAINMQIKMHEYNEKIPPDEQIQIKIAINWGYGIIEKSDVFGDVVNVAGKVITFCPAEKIYVTEIFFNEVKSVSEVKINPLTEDKKNKIKDVKLYEVIWRSKDIHKDKRGIFLLSLKSGEQIPDAPVKGKTPSIKQIIQQRADSVVNFSSNEVNATFSSSKVCLETAFSCLKTALIFESEEEKKELNLKAGIHAVAGKDKADVKDFQESINAVKIAQTGEVVITSDFYQFLDADSRKLCKTIKSDYSPNPFYRYLFSQTKDYGTVITSLFTSDLPVFSDTPCFYCGSCAHETKYCPSKFIQKKTDFIEKLGYTPFAQLFSELNLHLPDIVKPLEGGRDDDRFSILFNSTTPDQYNIYFFSYYEVSEIFQLRSLHTVFFDKKISSSKEQGSSIDKQSELLLGEDCLRVSRVEEAEAWFKKALSESAKDYRPVVGLGIIAVENQQFEKAVLHFNNALAFSLSDMQKACLHIFLARVYEVMGVFSNSLIEVDKSLAFSPNHYAGRFYKACLLCKMKRAGEAFDIFEELLSIVPKYFFMMVLCPGLSVLEKKVASFFNKYIEDMRSVSLKSYENIEKNINHPDKWFDKKDESFLKAWELYQKANYFINAQSLYGLMDIHVFEVTINSLMRDAFTNRQNKLRKQVSLIKNILYDFSVYLERFPYKGVISGKTMKLFDELRKLYDKAKKSLESGSINSLEETQQIADRFLGQKEEVNGIKKKLDSIRKTLFILEAFLRFSVFFIVAGGLSAIMFIAIIVLYNSFERSFAEITVDEFFNYAKFALVAGFFSGLIGVSLWFKKIYQKLLKKIE